MQAGLDGRCFLFLQGPSSPFFAHLGKACRARGARTIRLGFAPGDRLFWNKRSGSYFAYHGTQRDYPEYVSDLIIQHGVTDLVMLGDGRFYHKTALEVIATLADPPRSWVVEHGYLRPNLIAVEEGGHGGRSKIPTVWQRNGDLVGQLPARDPSWPGSFVRYAAFDVAYHASNLLLGRVFYPHYRHYGTFHPVVEYAGWVRKLLTTGVRRRTWRATQDRLREHAGRLYLFPLQLDGDFQLRDHGTGEPQRETVARVIGSFAKHAKPDDILVVKTHPLDNGWARWSRLVSQAADQNGIKDRALFADEAPLEPLLERAEGVVTINSTVGLTAILNGFSCHVLGQAIYNLDGLCHQGSLDMFWTSEARPDAATADRFRRFLRLGYHVPGAFDGAGAIDGAENLATFLEHL